MRTHLLLLFIFVYSVNTLPPKGCTSCLMVPVERHPHSGSFEVQKVIDDKGCFAQRLKCRGNKPNADTFVQFNQGSSGFLAHGEQEVKLECTNDGQWKFVHLEREGVTVESMACLST
ncbi:hypothetical protein ANCCAN_17688 [Ancylostoma caninum]|uniref:C6 domain-containing protein n=1 Tax=Ancylostoma caninum TaxID=29170 RepID=A0A368G090_ANCCA|nr:hypothetical protein ANCCAN_17688 [Ancylostoma caninum]